MQYRNFGKLGVEFSAFGLGCMRFPMKEVDGKRVVDEENAVSIIRAAIDGGVTYVDTAYVYSQGQNESVVGRALADGYRQRVALATKLPTWNCETAEDLPRFFAEQCAALKTDYIDFYLVHALNRGSWDKMKALGVREFLDDLKRDGKIKYACFSFHDDYEAFEYILNDYDWGMCQIQFNYLDVVGDRPGLRGLELAGKKNIPVVIMEGLLGGKLASVPADVAAIFDEYKEKRTPVEWAFRWLCNFPQVATVLSGTTDLEMTRDNLRIFDSVKVGGMSEEELSIVERARAAYLARIRVGCTGCRYCLPCPQGVEIPDIFAAWNDGYRFDNISITSNEISRLEKKEKGVSRCVECGACSAVCPQSIDIPTMLRAALADSQKNNG